MNLLLMVLLLGTPSRLAIPGGSIEVPPGCSATGQQLIDGWEGRVDCPAPHRRIDVFAGMAPPGCTGQHAAEGFTATLLTRQGYRLLVCSWGQGSPRPAKKLVVDVGSSRLVTDVGDAFDAMWLLSLAATFEPEK